MSALNEQIGGDHYKDMAIQPIEFCELNRLSACETLAIKYLCRHRSKNGRQDLEKAIHCIQLLMELVYPEHGEIKVKATGNERIFDVTQLPSSLDELNAMIVVKSEDVAS